MTSNIEAIRAAETQIPALSEQLATLREEALADDGQVNAEEQAEIDRVAGKITDLQRIIAERQQAWMANKSAYEHLRARMTPGLDIIEASDNPDQEVEKRAIFEAMVAVNDAADAQDYATALDLLSPLERRVAELRQAVENAQFANLSDEELADVDLTTCDTEELFTEEYMEDLSTMSFPSEGPPSRQEDLSTLMAMIERGLSSSERDQVMADLAAIVGDPPSPADLNSDYDRFLILRRQQAEVGSENGNSTPEGVDEETHPDFSGSRSQLMFGKVLGDAFGIHEVFAALLSPTGGLVGPGNQLIPGMGPFDGVDSPHLDPNNPVALHGTVHDAAGYLKAYHNEGPGYNYRDDYIEGLITEGLECLPESAQNVLLPLTGQLSGIYYWATESEVGSDFVEAEYDAVVLAVEQELTEARDMVEQEIADMICSVEETGQEVADAAVEVRQEAERRAAEAQQELADMAEAAEAEVREAIDAAGAAVTEVGEDLVDVADAAGTEVMQTVEAFEDAVDRATDSAVEVYEEAAADLGAMGEAAVERLNAVASFIWS